MQKSAQQRMLEAVQQQILPRLQNKDLWQLAFVDPPFQFPPGVKPAYHPGKPLSFKAADPASSSDITHNWHNLHLLASRFPCLGFVIDGSIDWRIGITERMAKVGDTEIMRQSDYLTLSIPRGSFFYMPPGVPYQEGDFNHWDRSLRQGIPIKVLYVQFHRRGLTCHMNYTLNGKNLRDSPSFVADSRTIFAAQTLIEELGLRQKSSPDIVCSLLQFCMQRLERGLELEVLHKREASSMPSFSHSNSAEIVEQVCLYLETHYDQQLSLERIANHVHVSPSHLTRVFRAEKGVTINEYLTKFRIEYVCTLLANTDLRINHIGKISGFGNQSYLSQVFRRHLGCTPQKYRDDRILKNIVR